MSYFEYFICYSAAMTAARAGYSIYKDRKDMIATEKLYNQRMSAIYVMRILRKLKVVRTHYGQYDD